MFSQDLAQDLPQEQPALDYVLEKARVSDSSIKLEAGRKALGALGLTGTMALRKIGKPTFYHATRRHSQRHRRSEVQSTASSFN